MRSSRVLSLLLSVFLCFSIGLCPAAAAGDYWTIDDLEADPRQELEEIKGAGPAADQPAIMPVYEFDDVASEPVLFSMDSGVEVAAEEGETKTTLSGSDFFSHLSLVADTVSGIVRVYHPGQSIAGITIPEWTEYRNSPVSGAVPTFFIDPRNFYFRVDLSLVDNLNSGEYRGMYGFCVPPFNTNYPYSFLRYSLDLTSLGSFSSFELGGVLQPFFEVESRSYYPDSVGLYINGALYRTFYPDSNHCFDLGNLVVDMVNDITSIEFRVSYGTEFITDSESAVFWGQFYSNDIFLTADIGAQPFRQGVLSGIGNIFQGILELPGKIVNLLIDGLKSLFIPGEDELTSIQGKYQQLLSERLGFIWQAYELINNLFTGIMDALESGGVYEFSFPGIAFPFNGEELVILPETSVSLENEVMDVIRPVLGTIVCFIAVVGFINVSEGMVMALISGVSYYEFLHGKKGGSG